LYSKEVTETLKSTRALGQKLKISGTPTFIIEEYIIRGYVNFDQMREIIKEIR
ncbi:MAG: disulfide bond formation protein DsbA, partial [Rhodobacteraceae bacterium]|nr:disulfide bond formation protein DsbA [Paracoccaceae bacterium]